MRLLLILCCCICHQTIFAQDTKISQSSSAGSGCDLFIAGIKNEDEFKVFFQNIKSFAGAKEAEKLSEMVDFPLKTIDINEKRTPIKDKAMFLKNYDHIMNEKVLAAIRSQAYDKLFCNYRGIMFGSGDLWINSVKDKDKNWVIKIITINS